jgi:hypothetical protein
VVNELKLEKPMREYWEVTTTDAGHYFTARPASGQPPLACPAFSTPREVREWLQAHGYLSVGENPDLWAMSPGAGTPSEWCHSSS